MLVEILLHTLSVFALGWYKPSAIGLTYLNPRARYNLTRTKLRYIFFHIAMETFPNKIQHRVQHESFETSTREQHGRATPKLARRGLPSW
jgi:hypothetical protein